MGEVEFGDATRALARVKGQGAFANLVCSPTLVQRT